MGIDVLGAGFPAASHTEFEIVQTIATELADQADAPSIAALCQCRTAQIERTLEALSPAQRHNKARLHTTYRLTRS